MPNLKGVINQAKTEEVEQKPTFDNFNQNIEQNHILLESSSLKHEQNLAKASHSQVINEAEEEKALAIERNLKGYFYYFYSQKQKDAKYLQDSVEFRSEQCLKAAVHATTKHLESLQELTSSTFNASISVDKQEQILPHQLHKPSLEDATYNISLYGLPSAKNINPIEQQLSDSSQNTQDTQDAQNGQEAKEAQSPLKTNSINSHTMENAVDLVASLKMSHSYRIATIMAYSMFRQWLQRRRQHMIHASNLSDLVEESDESIFYYTAMLLAQTMVFAIRADEHIDEEEHQSLFDFCSEVFNKQIKNISGEIDRMLTIELDPSFLASKVNYPEEALDIYILSAVMLSNKNFMELGYLENLAACLGIDPSLRKKLDLHASNITKVAN